MKHKTLLFFNLILYEKDHNKDIHTHFDVREDDETLKNVASDSEATALASMVFPLPGGPKRSRPE